MAFNLLSHSKGGKPFGVTNICTRWFDLEVRFLNVHLTLYVWRFEGDGNGLGTCEGYGYSIFIILICILICRRVW